MNTTNAVKRGAKPGRKRRPHVVGVRQSTVTSLSLHTPIREDVDVIRDNTGWTMSRTVNAMLAVVIRQVDGDLSAVTELLTASESAV